MKWIIRIYALALLGYTGWRTYDFLYSQLPSGEFSVYLAIFFLFATEAGLALWHEIGLNHSTTHEQQRVSTALVGLDFLGSLGAGIADMILRQTLLQGYNIPPTLAYILLYGLPILVAVNVLGVIYFERHDAETQLDRAKKQLKFEITRQALREMHENQNIVAESMKKDIFKSLRDEVTGKVIRQYFREGRIPSQPIIQDEPPALVKAGRNGRKDEAIALNVETVKPGRLEGQDRKNA